MRRFAIPILLLIVAVIGVGMASAEQVQDGNLRLAFNGELSPKKLPRDVAVPVTMEVRGAIRTADGSRPPELRKISIAFNRYGRLSTLGLPTCEQSEIEQTTTKVAREACGGALVGHGHFRAYVTFPGLSPVVVNGEALAFNSSENGRPALSLHIYVARPVGVTFIVPFTIRRLSTGTFATVLTARIPKIAAASGYVTNLSLTFARRYTYEGERRSFVSARCAVPEGVPGAVYTLARGSFLFSNGQRLSTPISRNCWVR